MLFGACQKDYSFTRPQLCLAFARKFVQHLCFQPRAVMTDSNGLKKEIARKDGDAARLRVLTIRSVLASGLSSREEVHGRVFALGSRQGRY